MESGERLETVLNGVLFAKLLDEVWLAAHWERKLKKQDRDAGTQGPSRGLEGIPLPTLLILP